MRLEALFRPKSIAVVGASEKPAIGRRLIASLDRFGFIGSIFPVNPNYSTVLGRQCYASIAELPEAPDVAVLSFRTAGFPQYGWKDGISDGSFALATSASSS